MEKHKPLLGDYLYKLVMDNKERLDMEIDYSKDYDYDFFGFKTLEKTYLYQIDKKIVERPQDMLMRVSLALHRDNIDDAIENYRMMSEHLFTHATPTLYNAGSPKEQFASCFLLTMKEDSIKGIYETLGDCAQISKHAGGIGLSVHDVRAKDSYIAGTNGFSNGLVPMLRVFNDTARYVDQGGGKRNGSFAIYLEPWHADILEFLELKKNHGNELERARDLFYGLWIPDNFMRCVKNDEDWYLFCPHECPGLSTNHSSEYETIYNKYVNEKKYKDVVKARLIWNAILTSQIETGTPYLLYKDACNTKSNQSNLGTIKSSNLCTEIIEYTSPDETAVCNLASISLKKCIVHKDYTNMKFIIYSKDECVYCDLAKGLMNKLKISYETVDYRELTKLSGNHPLHVKFPQVYLVNGENEYSREHIGGYTELKEYVCPKINYEKLKDIASKLTINLNNIIDHNYYPIPETKRSNLRHRPIGIGIQGLANIFYEMGISFDSDEAKRLNEDIFETIYYGAMETSMMLSKEREEYMKIYKNFHDKDMDNFVSSDDYAEIIQKIKKVIPEEANRDEYLGSYSSFIGSPLYNGKYQFNLWGYKNDNSRHDWTGLMKEIKKYGVRNSLLLAPMPTASTAQILGNYECFEPVLSNIYTRRVLAGEYMVINDYLVEDLKSLDLWDDKMREIIIASDGSIQNIDGIPNIMKNIYKTTWEIKQKDIINMAADRGKYICQSQSLNLFLENPTIAKLTSMHFYSWTKGLKTGIYYLRSRPSSKAIQFTVNPEVCENCSG
jgi:ribonucleoside-diphosphate reductase alpha subunit